MGIKLQCFTIEEKLHYVCLNYWSFQKTNGSRNLDSICWGFILQTFNVTVLWFFESKLVAK